MRWEYEARAALQRAGYEVVDQCGVSDYQGWGCMLGRCGDVYAVLYWGYGSCSGCDGYEDMSEADRDAAFDELVEDGMSEADGRALFQERQSRGW